VSNKNLGIRGILITQLQQKYDPEAVEKMMRVYDVTADKSWKLYEAKEALEAAENYVKERNAAGAIAKAKSYQPKKDEVSKVYGALKSANGGKNPALKVLLNELDKGYRTEDFAIDTITDWHKKLNKGLPLY